MTVLTLRIQLKGEVHTRAIAAAVKNKGEKHQEKTTNKNRLPSSARFGWCKVTRDRPSYPIQSDSWKMKFWEFFITATVNFLLLAI